MLPALRSAPRPLLLTCAFFLAAAYFPVRFPQTPGAGVGSYLSSLAIALPAVVALLRTSGWGRGLAAILAVSLFAYGIEGLGVATGLPYGTFYYGEALGPRALDLVPYLLPVTYVPLVIGACAAAPGGGLPARVLSATLLLLLADAVLDPGAASLGFWIWPEGGLYYGVPLSNYAGWVISGAVASALLLTLGRLRRPLPGTVDSLLISTSFWTGVALFSGLLVPALLGLLLVLYALLRRAVLAAGKPTPRDRRV